MTMESVTLLATLGTILFVAYLGLILWYGGALLFLRARGQVARASLAPSYGLVGTAAAGVCALAAAPYTHDERIYLTMGIAGTTLLAMPGVIAALLLARKTLPSALKASARPITVGAVFTAVYLGFALSVAAQARRIMAYENPDEGAVRAALASNPDDAAAHMSLAHIDISHGDYAHAAPELQAVTRLEPGKGEAAFLLAHALMHTGHTREAWDIYTRIGAQNDSAGWGRATRRYLARRTPAATTAPGADHAARRR